MDLAILIIIGLISAAVGLTVGISLVDRKTAKSPRLHETDEAINARISSVDQAVTDLSDKVTHWMRRNNMRDLREKREQEDVTQSPLPPNGSGQVSKHELRQRASRIANEPVR